VHRKQRVQHSISGTPPVYIHLAYILPTCLQIKNTSSINLSIALCKTPLAGQQETKPSKPTCVLYGRACSMPCSIAALTLNGHCGTGLCKRLGCSSCNGLSSSRGSSVDVAAAACGCNSLRHCLGGGLLGICEGLRVGCGNGGHGTCRDTSTAGSRFI
jgi:hypothetical protein